MKGIKKVSRAERINQVLHRWFDNHSIKAPAYEGNLNQVISNRGIMGYTHQMELLTATGEDKAWDLWGKKKTRDQIGGEKKVVQGLLKRGHITQKKYEGYMRYYNNYFKIEPLSEQEMCFEH